MDQKRKLERYIFAVSILLNIVFLAYGAMKVYNKPNSKFWTFINNHQDRILVDKNHLNSESTAIILTLGQSNSACYGQGTYDCHNKVYEYLNGDLYLAKEPLLGLFENGGCSVWTRVSDMLIDSGHYKSVIIIPIGIGSSTIQCWSDGDCNKKLQETLRQIKKDNIKLSHIIWHQGESDNIESTSKGAYKTRLNKILSQIREQGINSDFYVCIATYHPNEIGFKTNGIDTTIQNAQFEFVKEVKGAKLGANTDLINLAVDRYDGVHFSRIGLEKFAREMYYKLIE